MLFPDMAVGYAYIMTYGRSIGEWKRLGKWATLFNYTLLPLIVCEHLCGILQTRQQMFFFLDSRHAVIKSCNFFLLGLSNFRNELWIINFKMRYFFASLIKYQKNIIFLKAKMKQYFQQKFFKRSAVFAFIKLQSTDINPPPPLYPGNYPSNGFH